ncbi:hypothetical protein OPQ81_001243 [Rhizoctonia solani]|nr:hypothetical protein OPQ81_001243 [Rhizoctonia solani]
MRAAFIVSALTFIAPALSAPTPVPLTKRAGPVNPESYIIKLRDGISLENLVYALTEKLSGSDSSITHKYAPLWNGFAATLKGEDLNLVRQMPEVESVLEDSILSLAEHEEGGALDLVPSTASKHYAQLAGRGNADGSGVTIYGIDTGIYTGHSCFEGRAKPGISFVQAEPDSEDHNGHGTHTAGTAVCKDYGIATGAEIIAVKGRSLFPFNLVESPKQGG